VERSRRVRGNELNLGPAAGAEVDISVVRSFPDDVLHLGLDEGTGEPQIDEAWRGNFNGLE